ncbi:hypothetical protein EWM62_07405 [Mucilaginibacter terrigena]|uniref:Lipocalin-like domain-containing protein n=1 Tax=Mucilaginibacter terrigena TaxID=2492395 RepID=A0A4Q5LLG2_9SPHI|nr:hypothetical protein [Mucilaginibacter terrigena]RYU90476.1 hypothetical protein EWM62_07405 [Mucilaginibacter terrigena]
MKSKFTFRTLLLNMLLFAAGSTAAFAQCDKAVTLTSSSTNYINREGEVRTKDEEVTVTINKTELTIIPGDVDKKMTGPISSNTCEWKVPFKEGKSVIKALLTRDGADRHATVTIEGKDGKVTMTFEAEETMGRKIQVVADKFE